MFLKVNHHELYHAHVQEFSKAKEIGLKTTIHAGEVGSVDNVMTAIKDYHATRIGHGYQIADNINFLEGTLIFYDFFECLLL